MSTPLESGDETLRYGHDEDTVAAPIPGGPESTGFGAVLRNRSFLAIWTAQAFSQTAQNTLWYVLIIMVGNLTNQQPATVGLTIILVQLPTVLFSSLSGVLVDRASKQMILVGTNVIRVAGVVGYLFSSKFLLGLFVITFAVAVVSQPFAPAEGATLPLLVKGEQLITANSLFQSTFMASQAIGFAVGPVAIGLLGIRTTLIILSCLFAVAAVSLLVLPSTTREHKASEEASLKEAAIRVWRDLAEVTRFIWKDPPLAVALLQIALAPTLLLILAEIGQSYLKYNLGLGNTGTSLFFLLAPAGIGVALGIVILGQWGYRLRKDRLVLVSLIALGLTVIGLASVSLLAVFVHRLSALGVPIPRGVGVTSTIFPIAVLMGMEVAFINAPVQTIVQQRAAPEMRGRVLAMQQTLTAALAIPPLVLVGGLAALLGAPATLTLMGLAIIIIGLAIVYYA